MFDLISINLIRLCINTESFLLIQTSLQLSRFTLIVANRHFLLWEEYSFCTSF